MFHGTNTVLEIIQTGLLSLLIDAGKTGVQHQGLKSGGPMDDIAFHFAHHLLGNKASNSTQLNALEVMGDTQFVVLQACYIVIAGPNVMVEINEKAQPAWSVLRCESGDEIRLYPSEVNYTGQRYYLVVEGGFSASLERGETYRKLANGDSLGISEVNEQTVTKRDVSAINPCPYNYALNTPIRVIFGYQVEDFELVTKAQCLSQPFRVTSQSDRMGYRLSCNALPSPNGAMFSEGVHKGAIQIPPNGQAIVMLSDRQTLGGYPKIGAIAHIDLPRFVQALPGQSIHFCETDVYTARNAWRLFWRRYK